MKSAFMLPLPDHPAATPTPLHNQPINTIPADKVDLDFLQRLSAGVGANTGGLIRHHPDHHWIAISPWGGQSKAREVITSYVDHHGSLKSLIDFLSERNGHLLAIDSDHDTLFQTGAGKGNALKEHGVRYLLVTAWHDIQGFQYLLGFGRTEGTCPFSSADIDFGNRTLAAFWSKASPVGDRESNTTGMANAGSIIDKLDLCLALVDETLTVHYANRKASHRFIAPSRLQIVNGHLEATDSVVKHLLQSAVEQAMFRMTSTPLSLRVCDGACLMLIKPFAAAGRPLALLLARCHAHQNHSMLDDFGKAYSLTPAEKLLVGAMAAGEHLEAFAQARGISVATARTQLHAIFKKTNTAHQSDLVRLVTIFPGLLD